MVSDHAEQERCLDTADGGRVAYGISGPTGKDPAVVLLHGLASNRTRWTEPKASCRASARSRSSSSWSRGSPRVPKRVPCSHLW
jgi:pimeloyl-ACP methyl ester carboxylesterase